jgi:CheY-like chemotaxis protein
MRGMRPAAAGANPDSRLWAEAQAIAHVGTWEWDVASGALTWTAEHYRIGTGYSSIGQLDQFPVDELKIDRSFVARRGSDAEAHGVALALIRLGRSLQIDVVAEGIEREEQLEQLRDAGCTRGQGYYFWRPLAVRAVEIIRLPDIDGFEICRTIKELSNDDLPVFIVSGAAITVADRVHGLDLGADGYLIKPTAPAELVATLAAILRNRRGGRPSSARPDGSTPEAPLGLGEVPTSHVPA